MDSPTLEALLHFMRKRGVFIYIVRFRSCDIILFVERDFDIYKPELRLGRDVYLQVHPESVELSGIFTSGVNDDLVSGFSQ